jgi:type II secretory pathway pseudopilin PulG
MIELMVVIAIIALLASLILPAVQMTREASRRTQCLNNLKRIALAMHNYESSSRFFPPGYVLGGSWNQFAELPLPYVVNTVINGAPTVTTVEKWWMDGSWGWHALVLPYMDQGTIALDFSQPKFGSVHATLLSPDPVPSPNEQYIRTTIPSYLCPSLQNLPGSRPGIASSKNWAYSSYRGCIGAYDTNPMYVFTGNKVRSDIPPDQLNPYTPRSPNGMLYGNSSVKYTDVTDGTTNTLLLGESLFGYWADQASCCVRVWDDPLHPDLWDTYWRYYFPDPNPFPWPYGFTYVDMAPWPRLYVQKFSFGSQHSGNQACFALADGSAKAVSKQIHMNVFKAISTRNGALKNYVKGSNIENVTDDW